MATKLGSALKAARLHKRISQRELEERTGMSTSQISQIEKGVRKDPSFSTIVKIAQGLSISLDALAGMPTTSAQVAPHVADVERIRDEAASVVKRLDDVVRTMRAITRTK
ncbi:MAG: helix-turn-helix domain-containing protein [Candidatus Eremiobacteraeota bacterium]|nr:helix-turn-helix domain-containing protein [Candidatus Eremiobacteraeota bacterium]